jgi:hypothetical protein
MRGLMMGSSPIFFAKEPTMSLKAQYNELLATARTNLIAAKALREAIVLAEPNTKGSSVTSLQTAIEAAFTARTFAGEGDLDSKENPYRKLRKKAAPAPAPARVAGRGW